MRKVANQVRVSIEESKHKLVEFFDGGVITEGKNGTMNYWVKENNKLHNDFTDYILVINDVGYKYAHKL